jgi:hypothetical protein
MEFSHDEVRRQLRGAERAQRRALPAWTEALKRAFDPDRPASGRAKAELLGLADRRSFLKVGGATIAMSALLAACGQEATDDQLPVTGTLPADPDDPIAAPPGSPALDLNLLRTGQSIEVLAVETYERALDSGLVTDSALISAIELFARQHGEHADALAGFITAEGGQPYEEPNRYLLDEVVEPAIEVLATADEVISLAVDLENTAAQTYVFSAEVLTKPELRQGAMSIGGVEARHIAVLSIVQQQPAVPFGFMPRRAAIDANGYVD